MQDIHFFLAADLRYLRGLVVAIGSTVSNIPLNKRCVFHICWRGNTVLLKLLLKKVCQRRPVILLFYKWDKASLQNLPKAYHFKAINYVRLMAPRLAMLGESTKLIYLDSDILVQRDMSFLLTSIAPGSIIAAVKEPAFYWFETVGLPKNYRYFNSGVMCIDTAEYRKHNVEREAINYASKHPEKIVMVDQDLLNIVVAETWTELPVYWNYMTSLQDAPPPGANIHYSTPKKPWSFNNHDARVDLFLEAERKLLRRLTKPYRLACSLIEAGFVCADQTHRINRLIKRTNKQVKATQNQLRNLIKRF